MRELFPYLKLLGGKSRRLLLLGIVLAGIAGGSAVSLVSLSGWFITQCALVGVLGITTFSYLFPSAGIRAFALLRTLARYSERVVTHSTTFQWLAQLRILFFTKVVALPKHHFALLRSGDLLSRAVADIDVLDQVLVRVLVPTVATGGIVLLGLAFLGSVSPLFLLLVLPFILLASIGQPLLMAWSNRHSGAQYIENRARLRTRCVEALEGREEIRAYHAENFVQEQFHQELCQLEQVQHKLRSASATSTALTTGLSTLTVLLVAGVGIVFMQMGAMHGPLLVMLCLLLLGLLESIETLPLAYQFLGGVLKAVQRLNLLFRADTVERNEHSRIFSFPRDCTLILSNVSFRYAGHTYPVLHHLNCTFPSGTMIAVTGHSGAGKSTLLNLLAREVESGSGSVTLGGTPIALFAEETFRMHVASVSQDSHIFNATLRENLLMAKQEATEHELQTVVATVGFTDLLERLEYGLDTHVGEHGYTLSGGERRRLSIAQALLRTPSLLLLDEPTAGVDQSTAEQMIRAIRTLLPTSTIVIATHDPCLIALADERVCLDRPNLYVAQPQAYNDLGC